MGEDELEEILPATTDADLRESPGVSGEEKEGRREEGGEDAP